MDGFDDAQSNGYLRRMRPPKDPPTSEHQAIRLAADLHGLGLKYRSEGRENDARRIELQAAAILRSHAPSSTLLAEVLTSLEELEQRQDGSSCS